jgi:DNA-binding transcriptional MocR family regulator
MTTSYKDRLSDLDREGERSVTSQIADAFAGAIESGELEPGAQLPPTRELAAIAGVNHLTAARAYRRLAEMGLVAGRVGRGTFVRQAAPEATRALADEDNDGSAWQLYALPDEVESHSDRIIGEMFRQAGRDDLIPLLMGYPADSLFPAERFRALIAELTAGEGSRVHQYGDVEGAAELREQLAALGREQNWAESSQEIVATTGAAQAMSFVAQTLLRPGDIAAVESPTFPGSLNSIRATGASMMPVPVDAEGLDVDALEQLVRRRNIKLVTLQPRSHNPSGCDLAPERRRRLLELARREGFFVVEDGVYADLRYGTDPLPALRMDAPAHVIYVASFSKTISAGLRVGWIAARGPVLERIVATKRSAQLNTPPITELALARFLAEGGYAEQLETANAFYGERGAALLEALDDHLAGVARVRQPRGGGHVWLTLPDSIDERDLYEEAVRQGVSFLPGGAMTPERPRGTFARLSYGYLDPAEIREGVKRLAAAVRAVGRANRQREALPVA